MRRGVPINFLVEQELMILIVYYQVYQWMLRVLAQTWVFWLGRGVDVVDGGSIGEGDRLVGQQGVILVYFHA